MRNGLFLLAMLLPDLLVAQPVRFEHLTERDGLSQGCAHAIYQDHRGYLWIGTQDGLNRYDGYDFKVYYAGAGDSTSLSSGWITTISEGSEGRLWIGTNGALTLFDPFDETFTHFRHDAQNPSSVVYGAMEAVLEDREGGVWVGTQSGLSYLPPMSNGAFTHFRHDPADTTSLSHQAVFDVHEDEAGNVWIATLNGLSRTTARAPGTFARYLTSVAPLRGSRADPWSFILAIEQLPAEKDVFWLGTVGGLLRYNAATGESRRFTPNDSAERNVFTEVVADVEHPHVLWVGGRTGFYRFDTRTGQFKLQSHDPADPRTLPGSVVDAIYADRSGTVWVSASCGGLSRFNTTAARFSIVSATVDNRPMLETMGAGVVLDDDRIAVGARTQDGVATINLIDRHTGQTRQRILEQGYLSAVHQADDGSIWIGHHGLRQFNRDLQELRAYVHDPMDTLSLSSNVVLTVLEDAADYLWVGTALGLDRLDRATGSVTRYVPGGLLSTPLADERGVTALFAGSDGGIWVGTRVALHRFDADTETFRTFSHEPSDPGTVVSWIRWIYEHPRNTGVLWVGGVGLARVDLRSGEIRRFTTRDGLPNNTIYGILGDDAGRLWISTNRGLSRFDPETERFMNFGLEHGLQGLEFNEASAFQAPDGQMYFGGLRGLTAFYPAEITHNPVAPTVVLSNLRLFNQPVQIGPDQPLLRALDQTEEVRLRHKQNHVSFDFVGLHFQNAEKNRYAYRLENFDADWIDAGTRREATYANLPPGEYTFRVMAANSDGVWSDPRVLQLVILPPWWETWWAYVLYGLLLATGILGVHRFQKERVVRRERERALERERDQAREIERANRELETRNERLRQNEAQLERQNQQLEAQNRWIEEQNRKLRELDEVKSRFFANISHEFRTPLTLILGPLNGAVRDERSLSKEDLSAMRRSARRLLRLINQLLDLSRLDAGAMQLQLKAVDLDRLLRTLVAAFSSLAERKNVALVYDGTREGRLPARIDPGKIEQVVTNLLSNAIKFTSPGGKVRLAIRSVTCPDETCTAEIVVEDTGCGIPQESLPRVFDRFYQVDESPTREHEGSGIGLSLTRELVELHGGTIRVESKTGFGTSFTFLLPLGAVQSGDVDDAAPLGDKTDISLPTSGDGFADDMNAETTANGDLNGTVSRGTILVVDDNSDMQIFLERLLRGEGYEVELADDGVRGKDRAVSLQPDLILADVMMPRMDGFALCKSIKQDERTAAVPVVLLTARAGEEDRLEGLGAGADDYLSKPFSPEELMLRVENLIQIRRRLREQFSGHVRLGPTEIAVPSAEASFVEQVRSIVENGMSDSNFGVESVADAVGLSPRQLHRRIKEVTGLTPGGFIRMMRLQRAEQLLRQQAGQVAEVAYAVGFNDAKYFSRLFRQAYGRTPSEYAAADLT